MGGVTTQSLVAFGGVLVAAAVALKSGVITVSPRAVLAAVPWTVAAVLAVVASRDGTYVGYWLWAPLTTAPTPETVLATVVGFAIVAWLGAAYLAALRDITVDERYLAASGLAATVVLAAAYLGGVGEAAAIRLLWIPLAALCTALLAGVGYVLLGFAYTDALVELGGAGLFVVGAVGFEAVASAFAVEVLGGAPGFASGLLLAALATNTGATTAVIWPVVLSIVVLAGVAFTGVCGRLARERRPLGCGIALLGSASALGSGLLVLLSAATLG